jgi:hypothetical protein
MSSDSWRSPFQLVTDWVFYNTTGPKEFLKSADTFRSDSLVNCHGFAFFISFSCIVVAFYLFRPFFRSVLYHAFVTLERKIV